VGSLAWSPDGRRIAFSTTRTSGPRTATRDCGQIWWMWADGRHAHRVVWHEPHVTGISWSPDGAWLAAGFEHQNMTVACGDDRPLGIAIVRPDGTGLRGLGVRFGTDPDWSPDGRWIVYRDWRRTCHVCGELWLIRPDGSGNRVLVPVPASEGAYHMPRYAPGGARIAAVGESVRLFRASDGARLRSVATGVVTSLDW
jgi:Tol biopolymer transport system component